MRWLTLLLIFCLFAFPSLAFAEGEDDPLWHYSNYEKKVYTIGQRLLQANHIQEKIFFSVIHDNTTVNASAGRVPEDTITVYKGLLNYISSDDELAAVLGHEITHITHRHSRKATLKKASILLGLTALVLAADPNVDTSNWQAPKPGAPFSKLSAPLGLVYEKEADRIGIDYMVAAGYNPMAMESVMNKISADRPLFRWDSHPAGTERINAIHNYIASRYPQFLSTAVAKNDNELPAKDQPASNLPPDLQVQPGITQASPTQNDLAITGKAPIAPAGPGLPLSTPPSSVINALLSLNPDQMKVLRALNERGYISEEQLQTEYLHEMPDEYRDALLAELANKNLIRVVGTEPDRVYILTDWISGELKQTH